MKLIANVAVHQEDDWYVAKCVENSVASQGKSIEEALNNLREALELYAEDNENIPIYQRTLFTTMEIAV